MILTQNLPKKATLFLFFYYFIPYDYESEKNFYGGAFASFFLIFSVLQSIRLIRKHKFEQYFNYKYRKCERSANRFR